MKKDLQDISKNHPFLVPESYFEGFEMRLLEKVKSDAPLESTEQPFNTPLGYFDSVENNVLLAINASRFESNKIPHPFKTPEGYFEAVEQTVQAKLKNNIPFQSPRFKVWKRYSWVAVAASVVLIAVAWFSQKITPRVSPECTTSACILDKVSPDELRTELNYIELTDDELTDLLTEKDLEELVSSIATVNPQTGIEKTPEIKSHYSDESVIPFEDEELESDFFDDIQMLLRR